MGKNRAAVAAASVSTVDALAAIAAAGDAENRFLSHLPVENVIFTPAIQNPGKPWSDGTVARTLAVATIEMGNTGLYFPNCRIQHLRMPGGVQKFDLMMPTTPRAGGKVHIPVFDSGKGTDVDADFSAWKTLVVDRWLRERKAAVLNGAPTIAASIRNSGITVDDSMLSDLGITDPTPAPPNPAPAAVPTV